MKIIQQITNLFPVWILAGAAIALIYPPLFIWFNGQMITAGLGIIMLGMWITLSVQNFRALLYAPRWIAVGVILQYTIMPSMGWLVATLFRLPPAFAAGLILVSCCPGGTASNVVSYLAKADVPLSVAMTSLTTLMAVFMTPLLTTWLAGSRVTVDGWGLFWSTLQVVILPVAVGVLLNQFMKKLTAKVIPFAPLTAVIFIVLIVASIVGQGRDLILDSGFRLVFAVISVHALGFFLGYSLSKLWIRSEIPSRTISIEVGMQNSGLGVVLAKQNFHHPAVAIPCAISSVVHSLIGSLLAAIWRKDAEKYEN